MNKNWLMKISIVTKKNNLPSLKKLAARIQRATSEYGYFKEQSLHPSGLSYAALIMIHEYGTKGGRIPARKPFSITLFQEKNNMLRATLRDLSKVVDSCSNATVLPLEKPLLTFGSLGVYNTRRIFGSNSLLANSTPIRKKSGSSNNTPLVDFGNLKNNMAHRNSITKKVTV